MKIIAVCKHIFTLCGNPKFSLLVVYNSAFDVPRGDCLSRDWRPNRSAVSDVEHLKLLPCPHEQTR